MKTSVEDTMDAYVREGEEVAFALGNRGAIKFNADGTLDEDIVEAYWRVGFYVFEGALGDEELADLQADLAHAFERGRRIGTGKGHPLTGKTVDVRRSGAGMTIKMAYPVVQVIDGYEQDIGTGFLGQRNTDVEQRGQEQDESPLPSFPIPTRAIVRHCLLLDHRTSQQGAKFYEIQPVIATTR